MKSIAKIFFILGLLVANLVLINNTKTKDSSYRKKILVKESIQKRELIKNYETQTSD